MSRIGVMIPTYNRPDFLRACVAQWCLQTIRPNVICVHQNGSPESYEWCVDDMKSLCNIQWLHTPSQLDQHFWYLTPLQHLLNSGCDYFFWSDHDDIYFRDHVEKCLQELRTSDITISRDCRLLHVKKNNYKYLSKITFNVHAPGGMSSSMAFTRQFAVALRNDLKRDLSTKQHAFTDEVLARETMPRFRVSRNANRTTMYVNHENTVSSSHWLDGAFPNQQ